MAGELTAVQRWTCGFPPDLLGSGQYSRRSANNHPLCDGRERRGSQGGVGFGSDSRAEPAGRAATLSQEVSYGSNPGVAR